MEKCIRVRLAAIAVASITLLLASQAHAATVLEYDFRTAPSGTDLSASAAKPGASAVAKLVDSNGDGTGTYPTVNTGTAMGPLFAPELENGSYTVGGPFNNQGMITKNTAGVGNNNYWVNYYGSGQGMGTGSAMVVFKPNKTDHNYPAGFFITSGLNDYGYFNLRDDSTTLGPALDLNGASINLGDTGAWDSSAWYILLASWKTGDQAFLYLKKLSPSGTLFSSSGGNVSTALTALDSYVSHPIAFNAYGTFALGYEGASYGYGFNSSVSLYRFTTDYIDSTTKFNALVSVLVPEPASLSLVGLMGVVICRRKR